MPKVLPLLVDVYGFIYWHIRCTKSNARLTIADVA